MTKDEAENKVNLVDSTVDAVRIEGNSVVFQLSDIEGVDSGIKGELLVRQVSSILRMGENSHTVAVEKEDGTLLNWGQRDGNVWVMIEWNDYTNKQHEIVVYDFPGAVINFVVFNI